MLETAELAALRRRLSSLTPREREVLPLVVSGLLNKQVAGEVWGSARSPSRFIAGGS